MVCRILGFYIHMVLQVVWRFYYENAVTSNEYTVQRYSIITLSEPLPLDKGRSRGIRFFILIVGA